VSEEQPKAAAGRERHQLASRGEQESRDVPTPRRAHGQPGASEVDRQKPATVRRAGVRHRSSSVQALIGLLERVRVVKLVRHDDSGSYGGRGPRTLGPSRQGRHRQGREPSELAQAAAKRRQKAGKVDVNCQPSRSRWKVRKVRAQGLGREARERGRGGKEGRASGASRAE
jgi:hypothetical protein